MLGFYFSTSLIPQNSTQNIGPFGTDCVVVCWQWTWFKIRTHPSTDRLRNGRRRATLELASFFRARVHERWYVSRVSLGENVWNKVTSDSSEDMPRWWCRGWIFELCWTFFFERVFFYFGLHRRFLQSSETILHNPHHVLRGWYLFWFYGNLNHEFSRLKKLREKKMETNITIWNSFENVTMNKIVLQGGQNISLHRLVTIRLRWSSTDMKLTDELFPHQSLGAD